MPQQAIIERIGVSFGNITILNRRTGQTTDSGLRRTREDRACQYRTFPGVRGKGMTSRTLASPVT